MPAHPLSALWTAGDELDWRLASAAMERLAMRGECAGVLTTPALRRAALPPVMEAADDAGVVMDSGDRAGRPPLLARSLATGGLRDGVAAAECVGDVWRVAEGGGSTASQMRLKLNVLPLPSSDCTTISPCSFSTKRIEITRPKPEARAESKRAQQGMSMYSRGIACTTKGVQHC